MKNNQPVVISMDFIKEEPVSIETTVLALDGEVIILSSRQLQQE